MAFDENFKGDSSLMALYSQVGRINFKFFSFGPGPKKTCPLKLFYWSKRNFVNVQMAGYFVAIWINAICQSPVYWPCGAHFNMSKKGHCEFKIEDWKINFNHSAAQIMSPISGNIDFVKY